MTIGQRIRARRVARIWSQDVLADLCGVTKNDVSRWETGKHLPSAEAVRTLANALDITTDWLLGAHERNGQ